MSRYWVDLGEWDYDLVTILGEDAATNPLNREDVELEFLFDWVNKEMKSLANTARPGLLGDYWVFKTESLAEAEEIHWKATRIVALAFPGQEEMNMEVSILRQTECSECGCLGVFSDDSCIRCGSQVLWEEYIEDEGAMTFDGKKLRVRCTHRNLGGNQCGNLIWHDQVACYVHRQTMTAGIQQDSDQIISSQQESIGR
jgi:hypothetical protein